MTKDFTRQGICQAKKGLLFLRDCGAAATAICRKCGRPICEKHQIREEEGLLCPECLAHAEDARERDEEQASAMDRSGPGFRAGRRRYYYDNYHYIPIYYGHYHYFSDHDYRTFDEGTLDDAAALAAVEAMGDTGEGGEEADWGELDDFMES